jgi:hypothetical protein
MTHPAPPAALAPGHGTGTPPPRTAEGEARAGSVGYVCPHRRGPWAADGGSFSDEPPFRCGPVTRETRHVTLAA